MKVHIINGSSAYKLLFLNAGHTITGERPDLIVFTGGADVSPELYGDKKHNTTWSDMYRDKQEIEVFNEARLHGIPMVGICRGGQFLNVMSSGRMYQHVTKHAIGGLHEITDLETGETVYVTSTHHQMIMPAASGLIVATAALGGSREWYDHEIFRKDVSQEDIEVVYYKDTKCLCFQPHPEFHGQENDGMRNYFFKLLEKYLGIK